MFPVTKKAIQRLKIAWLDYKLVCAEVRYAKAALEYLSAVERRKSNDA